MYTSGFRALWQARGFGMPGMPPFLPTAPLYYLDCMIRAIRDIRRLLPALMAASFLFAGRQSLADEAGIPADTWPADWFRAPLTASARGITTFHQAPSLAARVEAGQLPALAQRLPEDPYVIEPAERIGVYGGTMRVFHRDAGLVTGLTNPMIMDPGVRAVLPDLVSEWEFSDGARTLTVHLRPGLKWSDGQPFTSQDWLAPYHWIRRNEELTPVTEPRWLGATVIAPDAHTVVLSFARPYPFLVQEMAHAGANYWLPAHFMKDYHPDFVDRDTLIQRAEEAGFISWMAYFNAVRGEGLADPSGVPTMNAFVLTRKSPTLQIYTRNPYYPKIDPAGNQLPYIDTVMSLVVQNPEVVTAKTSTGQVHFSAISLATPDIPLFKRGEQAGNFTARIWNRLHGVDVVIQPNLTVEDPVLREIFQDYRFRQALSIAIHRDEINTIVYFDRATPRQTTVIPTSVFYEPAFARASIEYDPDRARRLLDEMGLRDRDGDGIRERRDGEPLSMTLEWVDIETPKGITMELVTSYWRDVGIQLNLKQVDNSLQSSRATANLMEMTLWHADRTSDILFPSQPFWFVPMHRGWEECHWTPWSDWYRTSGSQGEPPPPEVQRLVDWWVEMTTSADPDRRVELGKNILRSQAENLWTIGTLGLAPQPVVVSNDLHNVPERGWFGWDNRMTLPYHPYTWFLEEVR